MKNYYNTLIIGSGAAGYNAADRLYELGVEDVAIITEGRFMGTSRNTGSDKQTYYKLSLAGEEGDSVREMAKTLYEGGGVMGEHAMIEAAYSTRCFMRLVELGVRFPTNSYGEFVGYKTDHDPRRRATSVGPLTSKYMTEALEKSVIRKGIEIIDFQRVVKIITKDKSVVGVAAVSTVTGETLVISCNNVILATGGPASIYENSVYPESQSGATSLAIEAGAELSNMEEWQYGIASIGFRWNLSGTYQQVLPRYISLDDDGEEKEFLFEEYGERSLDLVFKKGYEWPFDTRKLDGSSLVDLAVKSEINKGRRVFLDYTKNPKGLDGFEALGEEAYSYLKNSDALFGTPFERLERMNSEAVKLYLSKGIDLKKDLLPISVSSQHCNGGVKIDENFESDVEGLYAIGECAGTFGVYRPGGSALNSTQVGGLRAAEHIASKKAFLKLSAEYSLPEIRYGKNNISEKRSFLQHRMSLVADLRRDTVGMTELFEWVSQLADSFFDTVLIEKEEEKADLFRLYDTVVTARAVLSAMLFSAREIGTHGSAIVDGIKAPFYEPRSTRTLTDGFVSRLDSVSPLPDPELWFEKVFMKGR